MNPKHKKFLRTAREALATGGMSLLFDTRSPGGIIRDINDINKDIQQYLDTEGRDVPEPLLKLLSDLDWTLQSY